MFLHHFACIPLTIKITCIYLFSYHRKKAMDYKRFGKCLTNARQKSRYVFGLNFTDLVYVDRHHSLLIAFMPGSI